MLISVAMPIYDGASYLEKAISSILSQNVDFELVISDDGSRDSSLDIARGFSDSRIRILTNKDNLGIFGNLNCCIAAARGQFVQVFSQDDIMMPGYLASQASMLGQFPEAGLVYGAPEYIGSNGESIGVKFHDSTPELIRRGLYVWIASHYGSLPASISSIMVRKRTFEEVGVFDPTFRVAGDIEFYNRVSDKFPILYNKNILHSVRSHRRATSALSSAGPLYLQEELALESWYRERWNSDEYRKVKRFRSAARGRYHLGWIRRTAFRGQVREAASALSKLNRIYPLGWVLWGCVQSFIMPGTSRLPLIAPPQL